MKRLAVYTTIYSGVEPYLSDWFSSVAAQTDKDFELWIGLDGISPQSLKAFEMNIELTLIPAEPGDTPAGIRQRCLAQIAEKCEGVILVDSDDILHISRVAAARRALETSDLVGCGLELVDDQGRQLGMTFGAPSGRAEDVIARNNVFGFSNSAYTSELLRRCLPIPAVVVLVDWFLATKAWLLGAKLDFDSVPRMQYRQYQGNMARVQYPVSPEQVIQDTGLVRRHFEMVLSLDAEEFLPERVAQVQYAASEIEAFNDCIVHKPIELKRYVDALNILSPAPLWWSSVANPAFDSMWQRATNHECT